MQGWECKTTNSAFQLKCADTAQPCCYSGDIAHAGVNQDAPSRCVLISLPESQCVMMLKCDRTDLQVHEQERATAGGVSPSERLSLTACEPERRGPPPPPYFAATAALLPSSAHCPFSTTRFTLFTPITRRITGSKVAFPNTTLGTSCSIGNASRTPRRSRPPARNA